MGMTCILVVWPFVHVIVAAVAVVVAFDAVVAVVPDSRSIGTRADQMIDSESISSMTERIEHGNIELISLTAAADAVTVGVVATLAAADFFLSMTS
jgi:hypothetical protein